MGKELVGKGPIIDSPNEIFLHLNILVAYGICKQISVVARIAVYGMWISKLSVWFHGNRQHYSVIKCL